MEFRQKLRNTFRFILGNLVGLSPDPLACGLRPLDRLLVQECQRVREAIFHHFDNMEFSQGTTIVPVMLTMPRDCHSFPVHRGGHIGILL